MTSPTISTWLRDQLATLPPNDGPLTAYLRIWLTARLVDTEDTVERADTLRPEELPRSEQPTLTEER